MLGALQAGRVHNISDVQFYMLSRVGKFNVLQNKGGNYCNPNGFSFFGIYLEKSVQQVLSDGSISTCTIRAKIKY